MRNSMRSGICLPLGLLFGLTVVLAGAAIGLGAIPDSDGKISACYDFEGRGKGKVRLVDVEAGETCRAAEKPLDWYSAAGSEGRYLRRDTFVVRVSNTGFGQECSPSGDCVGIADCYIGTDQYELITGGYESIDGGTHLISSGPNMRLAPPIAAYGWRVEWRNNGTSDTVRVIAVCSRTLLEADT